MKLLVRCVAILAASALLLPFTAEAAEPIFAPPLEQTLKYEVVQTRTSSGQVQQKIASTDMLTFSKTPEGYRLTWLSGQATIQAPAPMDSVLRQLLEIAAAQPMILEVSAAGEVTGVVDLSKWRAVRGEMFTSLASNLRVPAVQRILASLKQAQDRQTDDQLIQELIDTPSLMSIGGALGMKVGEAVTTHTEMPLSIGPGKIGAELKVERLQDNSDGLGHVLLVSSPDPAQLTKAMASIMGAMLEAAPAQTQALLKKTLASSPISLEERVDVEYEPATGLSTAVKRVKTIRFAGQERVETVDILRR
jgi:hypothetical protein